MDLLGVDHDSGDVGEAVLGSGLPRADLDVGNDISEAASALALLGLNGGGRRHCSSVKRFLDLVNPRKVITSDLMEEIRVPRPFLSQSRARATIPVKVIGASPVTVLGVRMRRPCAGKDSQR